VINNKVILVPYSDDILAETARRVINNATALPDLTNTVVLLPDLQFAPQLRKHLLDEAARHGQGALLGPDISTLDQWLTRHTAVNQTVPGRAHRELMLAEALKSNPSVFSGSDPWQIAASLVALFDELTLHRVPVPDSIESFTEQLKSAYGVADRLPEPLGMEATVVHRLWQAWHTQLAAENMLDPGMALLQRLASDQPGIEAYHFYLAGFDALHNAEIEWISRQLEANRAECILYPQQALIAEEINRPMEMLRKQALGQDSSGDIKPRFLDAVFQPGQVSPGERAAAFSKQHGVSPLAGALSILPASSPEQEAHAIELQVRRWLLEQLQPIAIVTEDRRLARRVRALLERAGVSLQDSGGWALSTTSTAAALERWLETVEEDFAHQPLLDVLKSPFIFPDKDAEQLRHLVYRLEQDIIQHESITRGLQRYRDHIKLRQQRLPEFWPTDTARELLELLNLLDQAADPLRKFIDGSPARPAAILEALQDSLVELGMWQAFSNDQAGERILQEWNLLHDAAQHSEIEMNWLEFRAWFGAALERHDFRPLAANSPVLLMTLQQAQLGSYAAIVIGACDREYLPVCAANSPFFNDPVRSDLGLPVWPEKYELQFNRFRRLLECAPKVLLAYHREDNGEERMPGPWLEALQTFHQLAWNDDLVDSELLALLNNPASQVRGSNPLPVPQPSGYPATVLPGELLPGELTVSAHRTLVDCPYRFFAAYGLKLKPREDVTEALEKAEYGSLVHRLLEQFHRDFDKPLTNVNSAQALALLEKISRNLFTRELEDNFEHRAWMRRWLILVPEYIDWQIKRQGAWSFAHAEQDARVELVNGRVLKGRLDRIDSNASGFAVVDYKTGGIPKQADVDSGEDVQLTSYALLTDSLPARVEYLQVDQQVKPGAVLEGEALAGLAADVKQRLNSLLEAIENGCALPAWGDVKTCQYCEMDGLCRKQAWLDETPPPRSRGGKT
jgi:ATP-dependent helicase/nuclease subunit B